MRNTFINRLCELAKHHEDIFLLCGDLGFSVLEPFADQFPERFLNMGIAEQNMTQVATGLAREGYNVFTYSIGNFPTLRCMEQIRYDVCYHQANVKIVAVGAGYAYGPQGTSHHTTEDIAMMRAIPDMTICSPADPIEARAAAEFMVAHKGPGYVRINKTGESEIHRSDDDIAFSPGSMINIINGQNIAILVTGAILDKVIKEVRNCNSSCSVYSAPFIGDYNPDEIALMANRYTKIITVEEHQLNGGFGSSIVECFNDLYCDGRIPAMPAIKRIAIPNRFISYSGDQEYLREVAGLSIEKLIA